MRYLLSIFLFLVLTKSGTAQQHSFRNYNIEHGFPEARVNALCEDRRGHLWIGTASGLIQFDGYTFRTFGVDDGIPGGVILSITEHTKGELWIGTDKGLCRYDGRQFVAVSAFTDEPVQKVVFLSNGDALIHIAGQGLFRHNNNSKTPFSALDITGRSLNIVFQGADETIWTGSGVGLGYFSKNGNRIFASREGISREVMAVAEGRSGRVWVSTTDGVSAIEGSKVIPLITPPGIRLRDVYAMATDHHENVWMGTGNGIIKYDGKEFSSYLANAGQGKIRITVMLYDGAGNLWAGTEEHGLFRLQRERFYRYPENDQLGKRVHSVIEALNGSMICGTSLGGTTLVTGKNYALLDKREGFTSSIVQTFHYASDSSLWVGTQDDGLFRFGKTGTHHYSREEGLVSNNITAVTTDQNGMLWLGSDRGIMAVTIAGDTIVTMKTYSVAEGLASNSISALVRDVAGTIWAGTTDRGLVRLITGDSVIFVHLHEANGLGSNVVHCIRVDERGNVFVGTGRGLWTYDGDRSYRITRTDGLSSNNVYALTLDHQHNLWVGTERGVDLVSFNSGQGSVTVQSFGMKDGYNGGEVFRNAIWTHSNGSVWFGTVNGLIEYNSLTENAVLSAPKIHLTGIRLFFDPIEKTSFADSLTAWYPIPVALALPYDQNNLTFSYVGIHHRNPEAVRYKWMLDGFSSDWSPPVLDRDATFSNLPPGKYTFRVMAGDENNRWTEASAAFSFSIEAPWWQWWWVRGAMAGAVVMLIWMTFYIRLRQVKARNRVVQERLLLEKHVLELEHEASRLQMNPHFIFNCLNSIQGLISSNDPVQAKRYLARFGKLMRMILENTREEFIPLAIEMQILEHYLDLERITTAQEFTFTISVDESVDPESVEIPPMLIQPFAENAVIHGIRNKQGKGMIAIHFSKQGEVLICEITDNGVGREASGKRNATSRPHHKSTATSVTQKRLEQYGISRNVRAGITFEDLVDVDGVSSGTKVVMRIPVAG